MTHQAFRLAQQILNRSASPQLAEDGIWGPKSRGAATRQGYRGPGHTPAVLIIQREANRLGHPIAQDGIWGPQTIDALGAMLGSTRRPEETTKPAPSPRCWYPTDAQMLAAYGQPGGNQTMAQIPFSLRLDWDLNTSITRFSCHQKVKDDVESIFNSILRHYGPERIRQLGIDRFGGCLNVRKKRGGTTWSAHAWGTAIDLYPSENQLRWTKSRALFARPEYGTLRDIFRRHGWMGLGECADFDWMHFQRNP